MSIRLLEALNGTSLFLLGFSLSHFLLDPPTDPFPFPGVPDPGNTTNTISVMSFAAPNEGGKVLPVTTTSAPQRRKRDPTDDRFLGLYKWTAPPPTPELPLSHFKPAFFPGSTAHTHTLNHSLSVPSSVFLLRMSLSRSPHVNWADITALLSERGGPGLIGSN